MKTLRTLVAFALFLSVSVPPASAQASGIILSAIAGTVELQEGPGQPWKAASAGAEIREGYSIRTGPDGRAQVSFPDKAVVWVKENATFGMQSTLPLTRKVQVLQGEVKVDVPHLKRKQTFEVNTANAVAAVRGTRFTVSVLPGGQLNVKVAYGEVKLNLFGDSKTFSVPQGHAFNQEAGEAPKVGLMSKSDEQEVLQDWSPGLDEGQRNAALDQKDADRASVQQFARQTDQQQDAINSLVSQTKDEDFAAGRSLVDVHGNLVRVDQKLLRPDSATVQFVNLVKRPEYTYKNGLGDTKPWSFTGGTMDNRLDTMQMKLVFDQELPQDLVEWPAFFGDNDVKPKTADFFFTNQVNLAGNTQDILLMGTFADYCGKSYGSGSPCYDEFGAYDGTGHDEIAGQFYIGSGITLADLNDRANLLSNKLLSVDKIDNLAEYDKNGEDDGLLWTHNADGFCAPDCATGGHQHLFIAVESYVIDNSGGIRSVDSLVNSGKDPFSLLKETAGEIIVHFKQGSAGQANEITSSGQLTNTDSNFTASGKTFNATGRNIDLVIIPDLAVSMVQRMATALSEIDSGDDESNN